MQIKKFSKILGDSDFSNFWKKLGIYTKLIFNWQVLYASGYLAFAILAFSIHYFFFCYHLIEFIKSQTVLRNVLKSIYGQGKQLLLIIAFFIVLEYFYSLVIYYFFFDYMPGESCSSVFICLATVYRETFTVSRFLFDFLTLSIF